MPASFPNYSSPLSNWHPGSPIPFGAHGATWTNPNAQNPATPIFGSPPGIHINAPNEMPVGGALINWPQQSNFVPNPALRGPADHAYTVGMGPAANAFNPSSAPWTPPTSTSNPQSPTPTQQPFDVNTLLNFLPRYLNQQMNNPFQSSSYGQLGAGQQQNMYGLPSQGWGWGP